MENMSFDAYVDYMFTIARRNVYDFIDIMCISASIKISSKLKEVDKSLNDSKIYQFLKKRGYIENVVSGNLVMTKGFVCAHVDNGNVEIWHDIRNRRSSVFVNESVLTGLPIALKYMERIN